MADAYVYAADATDFTSLGLAGALLPTSCEFSESENGESAITLAHPIDEYGKWAALKEDRIIKVGVPVRAAPEIRAGQVITEYEVWQVKPTATRAQMTVYTTQTQNVFYKVLRHGDTVNVFDKPVGSQRYKIKLGGVYGSAWATSGWLDRDAIEYRYTKTIVEGDPDAHLEDTEWRVKEQFFRVQSVSLAEDGKSVTVYAPHISYDLYYNVTNFDAASADLNVQTVISSVMDHFVDNATPFQIYTNSGDMQGEAHYAMKNGIYALLDPEEGVCPKNKLQLVRDNFELYCLKNAGFDRGVRIEYAKNLLGVQMETSTEQLYTAVIPFGQAEGGGLLFYGNNVSDPASIFESDNASRYATRRILALDCSGEASVGEEMSESGARLKLKELAEAQFANEKIDEAQITLSVRFVDLGDTEEYVQYCALERVYLYDTITVCHQPLGIDVKATVKAITWDCLLERYIQIEVGNAPKLAPAIAAWQLPADISGAKLRGGSVGYASLADTAIAQISDTAQTAAQAALASGTSGLPSSADVDAAIDGKIASALSVNGAIGLNIETRIETELSSGGMIDSAIDDKLDAALADGGSVDMAIDAAKTQAISTAGANADTKIANALATKFARGTYTLEAGTWSASAFVEYAVSFGKTLSAVPTVVATLRGLTGATLQQVLYTVQNPTETGFVVRITVRTAVTLPAFYIDYIACCI